MISPILIVSCAVADWVVRNTPSAAVHPMAPIFINSSRLKCWSFRAGPRADPRSGKNDMIGESMRQMDMFRPRGVHLVGSFPLEDAQAVFRLASQELGN